MNTFDSFTQTLRHKLDETTKSLEKRKAVVGDNSLHELAYTFRRYADDVIREGETFSYLHRIVKAHENACLTAVEEGRCTGAGVLLADSETWWEDRAGYIQRWIAEDTLRMIVRGVNLSNNPMYLVEEAMKVEAAKVIFQSFVSGYMDYFFDGDAIQDILDGRKRRAAAEEAERLKKPHTVVYFKLKPGAPYSIHVRNYKGDFLFSKPAQGLTRKPEIKAFAMGLAAELQAANKTSVFVKEG